MSKKTKKKKRKKEKKKKQKKKKKKKKNFLPTQQRDKYKKGYKNIIEIFFGTYRKSEK